MPENELLPIDDLSLAEDITGLSDHDLAAFEQAEADFKADEQTEDDFEAAERAELERMDREVASAHEVGKTAAKAVVKKEDAPLVRVNGRGEQLLESDYEDMLSGGNRK